jgi:hypothetical protein
LLRPVPKRRSEAIARIAPAPAQNAVNRRHDRLRADGHRFDEIASHARECQQTRSIAVALHLDQRTDDLVHVPSRTEIRRWHR